MNTTFCFATSIENSKGLMLQNKKWCLTLSYIQSPTDWYKLTYEMVIQHGGQRLLITKPLGQLLYNLFPEYKMACRDSVLRMAALLKVKVEDLMNCSPEYDNISNSRDDL